MKNIQVGSQYLTKIGKDWKKVLVLKESFGLSHSFIVRTEKGSELYRRPGELRTIKTGL